MLKPNFISISNFLSEQNTNLFVMLEKTIDATKDNVTKKNLQLQRDAFIYDCIKYINGKKGYKFSITIFFRSFFTGLILLNITTFPLIIAELFSTSMLLIVILSSLWSLTILLYLFLIYYKLLSNYIFENYILKFNKFIEKRFNENFYIVKGTKYGNRTKNSQGEDFEFID